MFYPFTQITLYKNGNDQSNTSLDFDYICATHIRSPGVLVVKMGVLA